MKLTLTPPAAALPWLLLGWAALWALADAAGISLQAQLAICLPLLAMFGLPHGAADWWLAETRLPAQLGRHDSAWARSWPAVFGAFYLLAGLAALAAILVAPAFALAGFIALSVWHFGAHDADAHHMPHGPAARLLFGIPPIAAPLAFAPVQSAALLAALGVPATPWQTGAAGAAMLTIAAIALWRLPNLPARPAAELACLLLLCAAAPPIAAFTAYFCLLHSPREFASLPVQGSAGSYLAMAALAAALIAAPLAWATATSRLHASQAEIQAIFWGLAVVTLPHVLCNWLLDANAPGLPHHAGQNISKEVFPA